MSGAGFNPVGWTGLDFLWKSGGGPMYFKAGNFSFQACTAKKWLRIGKHGTYLEFCLKICSLLERILPQNLFTAGKKSVLKYGGKHICLFEAPLRLLRGYLKCALVQNWVNESKVWQCLGASGDLQNSRFVPYFPIQSQFCAVQAWKGKFSALIDIVHPPDFHKKSGGEPV